MDSAAGGSATATSLPLPLLILGLAVWLVVTIRSLRGTSFVFRFLYLSLSIRFLVNFFHQYTTRTILAGQSINSVVTLTIILLGVVFYCKTIAHRSKLTPVYAFVFVLIFSGVYNFDVTGTINALLREVLFVALTAILVRLLQQEQQGASIARRLLSIFTVPLLYQVLSIAFRITTNTETDGSISYIGGYVHEGVFSAAMLCGLALTVLSSGLSWRRRTVYVTIFCVSIFFANYRTALLAATPIVLGHFVIGSGDGYRADAAAAIRSLAAVAVLVLGAVAAGLLAQRFADINTVAIDFTDLIKAPEDFDPNQRALLSGRLLIWSSYIFATLDSDLSHILVGFGPDAWVGTFNLYAHNVFVSYFYEVGLLGLGVYLLVIASFLWLALSTPHSRRWAVVSCHLASLILSTGTMTTVVIEGVIFYGITCGYTVYYWESARQKRRDARPIDGLQFRTRNTAWRRA